jgi:hypothetical protein
MDQRHTSDDSRQDSGFICLGKDQILQHVQENLLFCFFNNIRPPKKSLPEQVTQVLKKYGLKNDHVDLFSPHNLLTCTMISVETKECVISDIFYTTSFIIISSNLLNV